MTSVIHAKCHKIAFILSCFNAECGYAKCLYDDCNGAYSLKLQPFLLPNVEVMLLFELF